MKRLKEIEQRLAEIKAELNNENADIEALKSETDELIAERGEIIARNQSRQALLNTLASDPTAGATVRTFADPEPKRAPEHDEEIYKRAFLKNILGEEMTDEERTAFTHTTANTGQVVPKEIQNKIYSQIEEQHPLLKDVQVLRTGAVITIVKHTAIAQGDAKAVAEGAANDDEQNTFVNVELTGKDFSKHVEFSYRLGKIAIPAFEAYLVKEIGDRIGAAMAKDIVTQIKADLNTKNKFNAAVTNKLAFPDILKGLGLLRQTGKVNVYCNSTSLYNAIATLEGAEGRLSFIPNLQDNVSGQILGKPIKEEDALANGEILILDPNQFIYNIVQDILIEKDKDIKTHKQIISGIAIAGGTLTNDKAGAMITVTIAG